MKFSLLIPTENQPLGGSNLPLGILFLNLSGLNGSIRVFFAVNPDFL